MKCSLILLCYCLSTSILLGQSKIQDADGDTEVNTEATTDTDKIRLTLGGTEYFLFDGPRINVKNSGRSIFLGFEAGLNDNLSDNANIAIGELAMRTMVGGVQNVVIGEAALLTSTSGNRNTVMGQSAMRTSASGSNNVAIGEEAMYFSQGSNVVALGREAGENSGSGGVYIGYRAGRDEISNDKLYIDNSSTSTPLIYGDFNANTLTINGEGTVAGGIKVGNSFGTSEGTIQYSGGDFEGRTASGWVSLTGGGSGMSDEIADADGDTKIEVEQSVDNDEISFSMGGSEHFRMDGQHLLFLNNGMSVFIGEGAGDGHDGGENQNTAVGHNAMSGASLSGIQNVAFGEAALRHITSGERNTAIGQSTMRELTTGKYNVAVGEDALYSVTSDSSNVAIGRQAAESWVGTGGVFLGYRAGRDATGDNKLYIDNSDTESPLIYGEFDNDKIVINGTYEVSSDIRLKSDIQKVDGALSKILSLNGYSYRRKNIADTDRREIGVIAQEVKEILPDVVSENNDGLMSVNYTALIPVLIEALKEQQGHITKLENRLSAIEEEK